MIQPGRETNIPTSSGSVKPQTLASASLLKINSFTLTLGMVMLLILALLVYNTFFAKRRKR